MGLIWDMTPFPNFRIVWFGLEAVSYLAGSMDPYSRVPRSPKNKNTSQPSSITSCYSTAGAVNDDAKSPTNEQVIRMDKIETCC